MDETPTAGLPAPQADSAFERQMREMNEALLVSSVRLHELAEQAQKAEALVRETERELAKALVYADDIIATLREPFLVLDNDLRVRTANRSFYELFHVAKEETENRLVYDLGNGQWDIAALRKLLDEVLSRNQSVHDFEVEHSFPALGRKTMLLNARPFPPDSKHPELILLAVYDVSAARARAEELAELDRRKDEFLAMLSHELRNPLAPILNAALLLCWPGRIRDSPCIYEHETYD
jgi:nitrogen-specific signal transduction histidine kinase